MYKTANVLAKAAEIDAIHWVVFDVLAGQRDPNAGAAEAEPVRECSPKGFRVFAFSGVRPGRLAACLAARSNSARRRAKLARAEGGNRGAICRRAALARSVRQRDRLALICGAPHRAAPRN
jgi:hypothetical protein